MTQQFAQVEKFGAMAKPVIVGSSYGTVQTDLSNARFPSDGRSGAACSVVPPMSYNVACSETAGCPILVL
jgi:hypothetical protein